jgi:hypothetical protein
VTATMESTQTDDGDNYAYDLPALLEWQQANRPDSIVQATTVGPLSMIDVRQSTGDASDPATTDLLFVQVMTPLRYELDHGSGLTHQNPTGKPAVCRPGLAITIAMRFGLVALTGLTFLLLMMNLPSE